MLAPMHTPFIETIQQHNTWSAIIQRCPAKAVVTELWQGKEAMKWIGADSVHRRAPLMSYLLFKKRTEQVWEDLSNEYAWLYSVRAS